MPKVKGWFIPVTVEKVIVVQGRTEEEALKNFAAGEQVDEYIEDEDFHIDLIEWAPDYDEEDEDEDEEEDNGLDRADELYDRMKCEED